MEYRESKKKFFRHSIFNSDIISKQGVYVKTKYARDKPLLSMPYNFLSTLSWVFVRNRDFYVTFRSSSWVI